MLCCRYAGHLGQEEGALRVELRVGVHVPREEHVLRERIEGGGKGEEARDEIERETRGRRGKSE